MRKIIGVPFLALLACQASGPGETTSQQSPLCSGTDVPIYTNRFAAQAGTSGVATPAQAAAGIVSSDAPTSGASVSLAAPGSAPAVPASSAPPATTGTGTGATTDAGTGDGTYTAMIVSCGAAPCAPGQVAVDAPLPVNAGTGTATGGTAVAGPVAPVSAPARPTTTESAAPSAAPAAGAPASTPPTNLVCTSPPPPCPEGQSPQFTGKQTWECTDCSLVVTYGGLYGNYRRCVNMPHLTCPDGQVPTWVYEDEQWECQTTCNNGTYDQHTIEGVMVCVPC
jgi:hypothetical protein